MRGVVAPQLVLIVSLLISSLAWAGSIQTRDNQNLTGKIRLESGQIILKPESGDERRIAIETLRRATFIDQSTPAPRQPAPEEEKRPNRPARLEGLRAEYFAGWDLAELRLVRVDPRIDFWWSDNGSPDPSVPNNFSVRWTGFLEAAFTDTYTFHMDVNDGGRLWIDDKLLIDHWKGGPGTFTAQADLKAGHRHALKMEYKDTPHSGSARLSWSSKHQARELIPPMRLSPPSGTVPPGVRIVTPRENGLLVTPSSAFVEIEASDPDGSIQKVELFADGARVGEATSAPWKIQWKEASPGSHKIHVTATDNNGISASSNPIYVNVASAASEAWVQMPVGTALPIGSARTEKTGFTIEGNTGDIWGDRDLLYYVFQPLSGDGSIIAQLKSFAPGRTPTRELDFQQEPGGASAGLLIREHLSPTAARQAFLGIASDVGLVFMRREQVWEARKTAEEQGKPPIWLKLTRHGKNISAYTSADGTRWQSIATRKVDLPNDVLIGMAVASPGNVSGVAQFENVQLVRGAPRVETSIKGVVLRSGSIVAGNLHSLDSTTLRLGRRDREHSIPASQVARLLFRPVTAEAAEQIRPGRTGAVLGNGDFYDGLVDSYKDGRVRVSSVLFGVKSFNIWGDEIVAAILTDVNATPAQYEVRCVDGSVFRAGDLKIEKDRLVLTDASEAVFSLRAEEIAELIVHQ